MLNKENRELNGFKDEVCDFDKFIELLDITRNEVSEDDYTNGITVGNFIAEWNNNPLKLEERVDPDNVSTITRRTATFYRMLEGNDPAKNMTNRNIYKGRKVAYIIATIKLVNEGV